MSADTAQPEVAADPNAQLAEAADAFKSFLNPTVDRPRDESGRFASQEEPDEEIEAEAIAEVEEDADETETDGAAEEAQPDAVPLPASWSKEDEAVWTALPPEAQAKIAEREGQRETAVNQKFQEAANVKRANEALIAEANANRDRYAEAVDQVLSLVAPQRPPISMLNPQSNDYNPDAYHLANAQFEQAQQIVNELSQQRQHLAAQQQEEAKTAARAVFEEVERAARPAFIAEVPEINDPAKAGTVVREIAEYAVQMGIPRETFSNPDTANSITSAELHMAWKAMQYDKLQAAKKRVTASPKPEPKPQPAVRPGVATPRAAIEQTKFKGAMDRLVKTGSVEDGAAIFKTLFKGKL